MGYYLLGQTTTLLPPRKPRLFSATASISALPVKRTTQIAIDRKNVRIVVFNGVGERSAALIL